MIFINLGIALFITCLLGLLFINVEQIMGGPGIVGGILAIILGIWSFVAIES